MIKYSKLLMCLLVPFPILNCLSIFFFPVSTFKIAVLVIKNKRAIKADFKWCPKIP